MALSQKALSWLENNDSKKNFLFDDVRFRPSASFTSWFGLDNTFKTLRLHLGIDRGYSPKSEYDLYSPFTISKAQYVEPYGSYGSLLFLPVKDADFELRIAHMKPEDFSIYYKHDAISKKPFDILKSDKIGDAGNLGLSVGTEIVKGKAGAHTHTEVVSNSDTSEILDYILEQKYTPEFINNAYTDYDITQYAILKEADPDDFIETYDKEIKKRNIVFINSLKCIRIDYHTSTLRTFYSSLALFGM